MNTRWRILTDAKSEKNAGRVLDRFKAEIGVEPLNVQIGKYRGAHECQFEIRLESRGWSDAVYESIELGQRVGYGWSLGGSVLDDTEAYCDKLRVPGITSASWHLTKAK